MIPQLSVIPVKTGIHACYRAVDCDGYRHNFRSSEIAPALLSAARSRRGSTTYIPIGVLTLSTMCRKHKCLGVMDDQERPYIHVGIRRYDGIEKRV